MGNRMKNATKERKLIVSYHKNHQQVVYIQVLQFILNKQEIYVKNLSIDKVEVQIFGSMSIKKEEEYCYWIFDLKYDIKYKKTTKWEQTNHKIYIVAYMIQIVESFVFIFVVGEDNDNINSSKILQIFLYFLIALFGILNVINFVKLFTLLRKSSAILSFHEKEDDQGDRHTLDNKNDKLTIERNEKYTHENLDFENQQNNNANFLRNSETVVMQHNNPEGNYHPNNKANPGHSIVNKRVSIARKSIVLPSGGLHNSPSLLQNKIIQNYNTFLNRESHSSVSLLRFIGQFNLQLFLSCAHLLSVVALIVKIPPYHNHQILYSMQFFQLIPNNIFASIVGFNIIYNLISDTPFLKNILKFKDLLVYTKSLAKASGYFLIYLIFIAACWGSITTLSTRDSKDIPSILVVTIIALVCSYNLVIYNLQKYYQ